MSISHDSASTIVCKEVFDENSQPSEKEILEYARRLGIDPDSEPHLLELAREGLMAALPKGWTPVYDETAKSYYYYQRSTNTSTWEHPLDAVYRDLVTQARAAAAVENRRRASVDDIEDEGAAACSSSGAEVAAALPIEPTKPMTLTMAGTSMGAVSGLPPAGPQQLKSPSTRIPMKLAPLKRHRSESSSGWPRRSESSLDRLTRAWKSGDSDPEHHMSSTRSSSSSDRVSRDYTNLRYQDPEFYESPRVIEARKKFDLRDVLKRSESLSPRHEKDWKQLNSRFSSEENIIDIDQLSATSLGAKPKTPISQPETPVIEASTSFIRQQTTMAQPKELTLSGGGTIFLKSNRSRDTTPCHDENKTFEAHQPSTSGLNAPSGSTDDMTASAGERLKSILREKASEDDDRPVDEERKSVRFDLQKVAIQTSVTKFNESDSDEEEEEEEVEEEIEGESEDQEEKMAESEPEGRAEKSWTLAERRAAAVLSLNKILNRQADSDQESSFFVKKVDVTPKTSKVVGKRFVVENVSEKEHLQQQKSKSIDTDTEEYTSGKFENVKQIDLVSRSDSEKMTPRSSGDSRSSFLDELRKSKEIMLENMRKSEQRSKKREEEESKQGESWSNKILRSLELSKEENRSPTADLTFCLEMMKNNMTKEHEQELKTFKQELDAKLEETKRYLEHEFNDQKLSLEASLQERLTELKKEMADKEEKEIQKVVADMDETRAENLKKVRSELEVCYEKERQDILTNLKSELDQRKRELLELRSQEILRLENEFEKGLDDEKQVKISEMEITRQHNEKIQNLRKELEKEFNNVRADLRAQQREKITKIKEEHEKCLTDILRDFKTDEAITRKMYKQRLDEIRADHSKDIENEIKKLSDSGRPENDKTEYEKIRYEKRLLEDKYNTLKEKYLKLKKDMRAAVEKRNRRKELANATASETEMSTSTRTRTDRTESSDQKSPLTKTNSISNSKSKEIPGQNSNALKDQSQPQQPQQQSQQQRVIVTSTTAVATPTSANATSPPPMQLPKSQKFESDDTTTCSETTSNLLMNKRKKTFTKKPGVGANRLNNNLMDNPVENIRRQLEQLEDLGDQLPSNDTPYTVRYPFQDKSPTNVSSELEFFKHRIHLERDSVKRAREALRQQRSAFQSRQKAWKQRSARATLEQLVKEERELSDMEVSLHRTRSLLGEKIIHLRHLEQSLDRVANARRIENDASIPMNTAAPTTTPSAVKNDELTLSDMSSASSGFSSTELGTDTFIDKCSRYQESTEIIASLENLNSEIREIWGVLNKRQESAAGAAGAIQTTLPPALMYTDLSWYPYQHHLAGQPATVAAFGTPNIQSNLLSQLTANSHPPPGATQNIIAQYGPTSGYTTSVGTVEASTAAAAASSLIERTRNLKDWLRQARVETSDLVSPGQATL